MVRTFGVAGVMYYVWQYLKHQLTATNQYGVHSPFVYSYITKCLYTKPRYKASKTENVLLKSIRYFSVEKLKIDSKDSQIENRILKDFGLKASNETPIDLIYLGNPKVDILAIPREHIHNDSMVLIENIHRSKDSSTIWETLIENKMITLSIDLFHCGILFFRKEQVKEHFKIRI